MNIPYSPTDDEDAWVEIFDMLCLECACVMHCTLVDSMIEIKNGGTAWPEGGWVHDVGGGVSCLSYKPIPRAPVPQSQIDMITSTPEKDLPPVCGGCAARKGTDASRCRHTQADFKLSVRRRSLFTCHETGAMCGGWCRAIKKSPTQEAMDL